MSKTNHGTTVVTVGDEEYTLNFTLKAVRAIEGRFGGLVPALQELGKANINAIATIVLIGSGAEFKRKDVEQMEEAIFDCGIGEANQQVIKYISDLLNPQARKAEELEKAAEGNE